MIVMTMAGMLVLCLYSVNTYMTETVYGDVQLATLLKVDETYNASLPDDQAQPDTADACSPDVLAVSKCRGVSACNSSTGVHA
jgi:hypothetical protein